MQMTRLQSIEELNELIAAGKFNELVQRNEAWHVWRLNHMAERIAARAPVVRLVLVAGPSSAGKTTTSIRLAQALEDNGIAALRLSTDDYFVGDARNPRDANGEFDYEHIDCVDRARLVQDLSALFAGSAVHLRRFDFIKKTGFDATEETTLAPGSVIILEGIHALNPLLTEGVDEKLKFRIYLNVLTQIDEDILADDTRLIRRMVRDYAFRNETIASTLARWPSVEAGEEKWINPFRRMSDAIFNTALDYELMVLKPFVFDALASDPSPIARRLTDFLRLIPAQDAAPVPSNSILREAIGGSTLQYV